jgi:flagellar biosynthesis/type III secretory pathway protein FliH
MSFYLFLDPRTPAVATQSPLIKARDFKAFTQIVDMLSEVRLLKASSSEDITAARNAAQVEGYRNGIAKAEAQIEAMLTTLATSFDDMSSARRDDIASAAYAAVRAIIGSVGDEALLKGLVETSLTRINSEGPVTVEVATGMAERIAATTRDRPHIIVKGSEELGPHDCRIQSPQGRIVADLGIQLEALAARWGVEASQDTSNKAER